MVSAKKQRRGKITFPPLQKEQEEEKYVIPGLLLSHTCFKNDQMSPCLREAYQWDLEVVGPKLELLAKSP